MKSQKPNNKQMKENELKVESPRLTFEETVKRLLHPHPEKKSNIPKKDK